MCTISVIPPTASRGLRLVVNRDERRTRPAAWPPTLKDVDGVEASWPTDSLALGTWVAAASTGLVYSLMNSSARAGLMPRAGTCSRGVLIPALVAAEDIDEVCARLRDASLNLFTPFKLVVAGQGEIALVRWDGERPWAAREPLVRPRIFSSSSLGDALVEQPRRQLFEALLVQEPDPWRAQDRLHVHAWPDRRHLSVVMSRPGACTVSRTSVVVTGTHAEMAYAPFLEGWPGPISRTRVSCRELRLASLA